MKKRDIITLLEYQKSLEDSKRLNIKPYITCSGTVLNYSDETLRQLEKCYGKLSEHLNYQTNNLHKIRSINCSHPVLFFVDRLYCKTHRCILCGEVIDLEDSRLLINLEGTVEIEETATSENHYKPLNNFYDIYNYIIQMIEDKDDNAEINFKKIFLNSPVTDDFKKLLLKRKY